jgi:hypothetical protein
MKLAKKVLNSTLLENNQVTTAGMFEVSRILFELKLIAEFITDSDLFKKADDAELTLSQLLKKSQVESKYLVSMVKAAALPEVFKAAQKAFKAFDDSGKQIKYKGMRKPISLKQALMDFAAESQKAVKFYQDMGINIK